MSRRTTILKIMAAASAGLASVALAATDTWTGNGSANWSDAGSWTGGNPTPQAGDLLVFAGTNQLSPNDDLSAGLQINGITFSAGAGAFNVGPGSNSITFGSTSDAGNGAFF